MLAAVAQDGLQVVQAVVCKVKVMWIWPVFESSGCVIAWGTGLGSDL